MKHLLPIACLLTLLPIQACSTPDAYQDGSRALTADEIEEIYSGHTWDWNPGAAFFAPDHEFQAWSLDEIGRPGFAFGEWSATDAGLLCFEATWRFPGQRLFSESCFRHRLAEGRIYQREEPAGGWYIFRSTPEHPDNPSQKLVPGDRVGVVIDRIRESCTSPFARCRLSFEPPAVENPLAAEEIRAMFSNQTWHWSNGAGYFGPGGWFEAWSVDQAGMPGYGIGRWTASDTGLLCIEAPWMFGEETTRSERCFAFREEEGAVLFRTEPDGDWSTFRSAEPGSDAASDRLTRGNAVNRKVDEIRDR